MGSRFCLLQSKAAPGKLEPVASGAEATDYCVTSGKIHLRLPDLSNETSLVGRIEVDTWKGLRTHRVSVLE